MGSDTRVADELREYWPRYDDSLGEIRDRLLEIADRIDAAHEKALVAEAVSWPSKADDTALANAGLMRLPKDADGEVIKVGDVMWAGGGDHAATVQALTLGIGGWYVRLCGVSGDYEPSELRHHRPTPAERIRRVVCAELYNDKDDGDLADYVTVGDVRKLLAIADELDGGAE